MEIESWMWSLLAKQKREGLPRLEGTEAQRAWAALELAALQGLVDPGEFLELAGKSDGRWREAIGNAVPPPTAEAIGNEMIRSILLARAGETFMLSAAPVWVHPFIAAIQTQGGA